MTESARRYAARTALPPPAVRSQTFLYEHNSSLSETGIKRFLSTVKTSKQLAGLQPDYLAV